MGDAATTRGSFAHVHRATSEADVIAALRESVAANRGIVTTGAESPAHVVAGDELRAVISLAGMNRILEHEVQDLTIACEPGCTVAMLAAALAEKGQRLAIEVPDPETWTIGGVIAARADGFVRAAFGGVRDQILGLHVALSNGEVTKTGGRVVKNVTGYDLAKVYCGSFGSLGVITRLVLRLRATAPAIATFVVGREHRAAAFADALRLRDLDATISALAVAGGTAAPSKTAPWLAAVRIEGHPATLDRTAHAITSLVGVAQRLDERVSEAFWSKLTSHPSKQVLTIRVDARPSRLSRIAEALERSAEDKDSGLIADIMSGRIEFSLSRILRDVDTTCGELVLGRLARDFDAIVSIPGDPLDLRERFNRFGAPPAAELALLRRIKHAFDPTGLMAQGRFHQEIG